MNPENPQSCRTQQLVILASLLMLTAAFGLFMLRQVFLINAQVTQADQLVKEYTAALPKINGFVDSLRTYARSNPDFNPILAKYNLLSAPAKALVPAKAPAAPAAAPKK